TDGIVTLSDVVAELVGEIHDDMDAPDESQVVHLSSSSIECDATIDLRELNQTLGTTLPEEEERRPLNGFILQEYGRVPQRGVRFEAAGVQIEILDATP